MGVGIEEVIEEAKNLDLDELKENLEALDELINGIENASNKVGEDDE